MLVCSLFLTFEGWVWETENWEVDTTSSNVDAEGWSYSVDFQRFTDSTSGNSKKGALHFVRRKRKTRSQYFDGNLVVHIFHYCLILFSEYSMHSHRTHL